MLDRAYVYKKNRGIAMNLDKEIFELSLGDIMPNRFQPREVFEDEALMELAESIKQFGLLQQCIFIKVFSRLFSIRFNLIYIYY